MKTGKFWVFFTFGVNWRQFSVKNCIYLFKKDYWTTNSYFDERFQHSNPQSVWKFRQKLHKNLQLYKNENWIFFVIFGVNLKPFN